MSGIADTSTRLFARFTGVPAGVRVFVASEYRNELLHAVLVPGDAQGAPPSLGTPSLDRPVPVTPALPGKLICGSASLKMAEVALINGTGDAVWEVLEANPSTNETLLFRYGIAWLSPAGRSITGTVSANVAGKLAPFYPAGDAHRSAGTAMPLPRFGPAETVAGTFAMSSCSGGTVAVKLVGSHSGLQILIDGSLRALPASFEWIPGETHALEAPILQSAGYGTRRRFTGWSNGGSRVQAVIVPPQPTTFTANYTTQYQFTVQPSEGGQVTPVIPFQDSWYDEGATLAFSAAPRTGWRFLYWSGTGSTAPTMTTTVTAPAEILAAFAPDTSCQAGLPQYLEIPATGGQQNLDVIRSADCGEWRATVRGAWLNLADAGTGTGPGVVALVAEPNSGPGPRTAFVRIAGAATRVLQRGATSCSATTPETTMLISGEGEKQEFAVEVSAPGCTWTAVSNETWLQPFPESGAGGTTATFTAYPNFSGVTRRAVVGMGSSTFQVIQRPGSGTVAERFIRLLYFNYFGRLPSEDEIAFNIGTGLSRTTLAFNFLNSLEFNLSGRFVAGLYAGVLNRNAEYTGWIFNRNALSNGVVNRDTIVANFLDSAEFRLNNGTLSDAAFIRLMYRQILGREAADWEVTRREGLLRRGMTRVANVQGLLDSLEFRQGKGARLTAFLFYATLLNRDATQAEFAQRVSEIGASPTDATLRRILEELVTSNEMREVVE